MKKKIVLLLQGGGALGAFQCGVWKALAPYIRRHGHELVAVAGASIGAVNAGMITRHYRDADGGSGRLEAFWRNTLATPPLPFVPLPGEYWQAWNGLLTGILTGNRALFSPLYQNWNPVGELFRFGMPLYQTGTAAQTMRQAFGEYHGRDPLLLVGATDVQTGKTVLFDSASRTITPEMLVASASIPILFPPTPIDGRLFWDPEMRSNTLLPDLFEWLTGNTEQQAPREPEEILVVVVDMFSPSTDRMPASMMQSSYRLMNIVLGSKAKYDQREFDAANAHIEAMQRLRSLSEASPPSELTNAIDREYDRVVRQRRARIAFLHVDRNPLEFEHVSRDFDYSPRYIDRLIRQGAQCLEQALSAHDSAGAVHSIGGGEAGAAGDMVRDADAQAAGPVAPE